MKLIKMHMNIIIIVATKPNDLVRLFVTQDQIGKL